MHTIYTNYIHKENVAQNRACIRILTEEAALESPFGVVTKQMLDARPGKALQAGNLRKYRSGHRAIGANRECFPST